MSLNARLLYACWLGANSRKTESLLHPRSRREERQFIPGGGVSYCLISAGERCQAPQEQVE